MQSVGTDVRLSLLRALASLVITALLIVWLADIALGNAQLGDLTIGTLLRGTDPFGARPLDEALAIAFGRSAALLLATLGAAGVIGIATGTAYAFSGWRAVRAAAWAIGTIGASLPSFFWGMLLQLAVVLVFVETQTRILPTSGFGFDEHLVLPALALGTRPAAYLFRTTATALEQVRHDDFVRTARAKGIGERLIAQRHVLPNALPSIAAGLGLAARSSLSSLAIVEYIFSWHGAGYGFIHAIANGRTVFATVILLTFAVLFMAIGVLLDASSRSALRRAAS
jgi:ABC-type dipeptide/oligopeptide/nickel transport system permease component